VPHAHTASHDEHDEEFLRRNGSLVVKPARGEQGAGISIGVRTVEQLQVAVAEAQRYCPDVLLEEFVEGEDLRVIVINDEVVAAAIRRPATVVGTGRHPISQLIERQSKRRSAATHGESRIPMDEITDQIVRDAGYTMDDVLPEGQELRVRRTANLHTGGTIHDVTAELHPTIVEASISAARALDIPVTGLDLLVPDPAGPEHVFIEANERPGLANHEPQPTAEKFVDLLFPGTTSIPRRWEPSGVIGQGDRVEASAGRG
jgi:GNAT-family acetyltransferase (TIGR03103 family)